MEQEFYAAAQNFVDSRCEHCLLAYRRRNEDHRCHLARLTDLSAQIEHMLQEPPAGYDREALKTRIQEYMDLANSLAFTECAACYRQGYQDAQLHNQTLKTT